MNMDEFYPDARVDGLIESKSLDRKKIENAASEAARARPRAKSFETTIPGVRICIERKGPGFLRIVNLEMINS